MEPDMTSIEKMTRTSCVLHTRSTRNLKKQAQVRRTNAGKFLCVMVVVLTMCTFYGGGNADKMTHRIWAVAGVRNRKRRWVGCSLEFEEILRSIRLEVRNSRRYSGVLLVVRFVYWLFNHPGDSSVAFYTIFCTETQWSCSPYGTTHVEKQEKRRPNLWVEIGTNCKYMYG